MRVLAIDTSGPACSLALFEGRELVAQRHEVIGRGHAEWIIPWIAELPHGGRSDAILVGCGPGSFTGVRVGIAAGRALALGWGASISGMNSLALIAAAAPNVDVFVVAIEGGHGELFVQSFERHNGLVAGPLASHKPEAAAKQFDCRLVLGSGAEKLVAAGGYGEAVALDPDAAFALHLPATLRSLPPSPVYGRAPDAKPPAI
jgi:tRNA threonylcarbamoyladenosine biosynthesis protein TsaB